VLHGLKMKTTVKKAWLLEKLQENRTAHEACYEESRRGYIERAQAQLEAKMEDLKDGKATALHFNITVPENHVREYDLVIGMLEAHQSELIELEAGEYRMFVDDEWDWMDHWLLSNAGYSEVTRTLAESKGLM
jgi:protein-tyrosine-phosphatase